MKEIKVIVKCVWRRIGGGYDRTFDGTFRIDRYQKEFRIYSNCRYFHFYLPSGWIDRIHNEFEKSPGDVVEYYDYEDDSEIRTSSINRSMTYSLTKFCRYPFIKLTIGSESECQYPFFSDTYRRDQMLIDLLDKYLPIEEKNKEGDSQIIGPLF